MVKAQTPLATNYNDKSVLENMHSATLFRILDDPETDIFEAFSAKRKTYIRKVMIEAILGTDMSQHFAMCGQLDGLIHDYDKADAKSCNFVASMIVHAADLSNLLYEFDHYVRWAIRITQEFSDQYEAEERLDEAEYGPPTAMLKYTDELGFYKSQIGFMNFIITPMWEKLFEFFKFDRVIMDNLNDNKRILNEKAEELQ